MLAPKASDEASVASRFPMPARLLLWVGLAGMLTAAAALTWPSGRISRSPEPAPVALVETVTPADIAVVTMTYEPGQSSGWHTHPGLHAVAVVSGTLTVYGPTCSPLVIGPGESYVGGQELHVTRNEAAVPVEMVVTSVDTNRLTNSVTAHVAPVGCGVA